MHALVVYESMFGNTRQVAEAIADGLASAFQVELMEVGTAPVHFGEHLELVVVGGPTHAHGLSRPATRKAAADQGAGATASSGGGLREWLDGLPARPGIAAAAFDTRIDKPRWLTGSAARGTARRLERLRFRLLVPPASFYVLGTPGPLDDGELDRARRWGQDLARLTKVADHHLG
jgi:hypothetical protein